MSEPITDHAHRPDRQSQWQTDRCDKCGEPRSAHATDSYDRGWIDGYGKGRDDEAAALPIRTYPDGCANCGHPTA